MTEIAERRATTSPAPSTLSDRPTAERTIYCTTSTFADLLDALGFTDGEFVSILADGRGHKVHVVEHQDAAELAAKLSTTDHNLYFGVCPTKGPARTGSGRGTAADVTRLSALPIDLDVKPGGCRDLDHAYAIIAVLAEHLGTAPSCIVRTGSGLHAYWPIEDGQLGEQQGHVKATALLSRWRRLVDRVAENHGAHADNVFDLARQLRVPGSFNVKADPIEVVAEARPGGPLTIAQIDEILDDHGIVETDGDRAQATGTATVMSAPDGWKYADAPCQYAVSVVRGWKSDVPRCGRHQWMLSQLIRLAAMHRAGCLTAELHQDGLAAIAERITQLCEQGIGGQPRKVKPREISDGITDGIRRAASKSDAGLDSEVGGHLPHLADMAAATNSAAAPTVTPTAPTAQIAVNTESTPTTDAEAMRTATPTTAAGYKFTGGGDFILNQPSTIPAVWGDGDEVLWAEGESMMIAGGQGLGKTTLAGLLIRAQIRGHAQVLNLPVSPATGRILFLAMDRPRQASRAFARQFTADDRDALNEQLTVWQGPPPEDMAANPNILTELADAADATIVYLDSIKDGAIGLSDDAVGAGYNRARQTLIASGRQLCDLHHIVKRGPNGATPSTISDIYGSTWLTSGAGSVILLTGDPGDPIIQFRHVKQPAAEIGPYRLSHDHAAGNMTIEHSTDLIELAAAGEQQGITASLAAIAVKGDAKTTTRGDIEKQRRKLDKLTRQGLLIRVEGARGGTLGSRPATYFPASGEGQQRADAQRDQVADIQANQAKFERDDQGSCPVSFFSVAGQANG